MDISYTKAWESTAGWWDHPKTGIWCLFYNSINLLKKHWTINWNLKAWTLTSIKQINKINKNKKTERERELERKNMTCNRMPDRATKGRACLAWLIVPEKFHSLMIGKACQQGWCDRVLTHSCGGRCNRQRSDCSDWHLPVTLCLLKPLQPCKQTTGKRLM